MQLWREKNLELSFMRTLVQTRSAEIYDLIAITDPANM